MNAEPRWRRRRSIGSGALTVLGAMFLALGLVQLWATDTVFDADRFAGTAVTALERDDVRAELSRVLVDQTIAYRQDLITVRPLLETVANSVIASPSFRRLFVTAVTELHRSLFTTEQPTLLLDVSDATLVLIGGLRAFDPTLAERVPANVEAGLVSFGDRTWAHDLAAGAEELRELAWICLALGLVALIAAVALSPNRRRALIGLGAALTVSAMPLGLALQIGRDFLVNSFADEGRAAAAGAAFGAFTTPFVGWLWVMGLIGVGIAATATASAHAEYQREWLARSAQGLLRPPTTRGRRALYALGGLLVGLLLLTQPNATLSLATRAAGALLLYFTGAELLRLSGLFARPAAPAPESRPRRAIPSRPALGWGSRRRCSGGRARVLGEPRRVAWRDRGRSARYRGHRRVQQLRRALRPAV